MVAFLNCVPFGTDIADLLVRLFGYKDLEILVKISAAAHSITISDGNNRIYCLDDLQVMVSASIYGAF